MQIDKPCNQVLVSEVKSETGLKLKGNDQAIDYAYFAKRARRLRSESITGWLAKCFRRSFGKSRMSPINRGFTKQL